MRVSAKIYFANKPSETNKKTTRFLEEHLRTLNNRIVFDFIIANPKDKEVYSNMGITGFPAMMLGGSPIIGFNDIYSFLMGEIKKIKTNPAKKNAMDDYLHNEVFAGVEITDKGGLKEIKQHNDDDDEDDDKRLGEQLVQKANQVVLERKQNNRFFAEDNSELAKVVARQSASDNVEDSMFRARANNIRTNVKGGISATDDDSLLNNFFQNMEQTKF